MRLNPNLALWVLLLLITNCTTKPATTNLSSPKTLKFQSLLDSIYQTHPDAVGIMVHVEAPQQGISWSGAVGKNSKTDDTPIAVDQPALIASNTKTYVSATMLKLVEQGKLKLDQPIGELLTEPTKKLFQSDGYDLKAITLAHLLSHTSGIFDYVNADHFFATVKSDPNHRWTRDEQIALAISGGEPLALAGEGFSYADTNYSLLTEIMEQITGQPYYASMRSILDYKKHGLTATWFNTQEKEPIGIPKRVVQSVGRMNIDSYSLDHSFDLYGGGGIAASTKDLARFSQLLFNAQFFEDPETLELIFTKIDIKAEEETNYYLGLSGSEISGYQAYGHGGFWGTVVQYFPKLNASISVFILEKDKGKLRKDVLEKLVKVL